MDRPGGYWPRSLDDYARYISERFPDIPARPISLCSRPKRPAHLRQGSMRAWRPVWCGCKAIPRHRRAAEGACGGRRLRPAQPWRRADSRWAATSAPLHLIVNFVNKCSFCSTIHRFESPSRSTAAPADGKPIYGPWISSSAPCSLPAGRIHGSKARTTATRLLMCEGNDSSRKKTKTIHTEDFVF